MFRRVANLRKVQGKWFPFLNSFPSVSQKKKFLPQLLSLSFFALSTSLLARSSGQVYEPKKLLISLIHHLHRFLEPTRHHSYAVFFFFFFFNNSIIGCRKNINFLSHLCYTNYDMLCVFIFYFFFISNFGYFISQLNL